MAQPKVPIMSTAGAISIKNEKGQVTMEKVKVSRYVSGKRPDYAPDSSEEEEEEDVVDLNILHKLRREEMSAPYEVKNAAERNDRRMRRLRERYAAEGGELGGDSDEDREARVQRHRQFLEPEVLATRSDSDEEGRGAGRGGRGGDSDSEATSDEEEEELDEEEIERRRALLRLKASQLKKEEEVLDVEDEKEGSGEEQGEAESSSEYEEYSGSEEEDQPRMKPVFVRKRDRITIQEKETEQKQRDAEQEKKRLATERRSQTLKMVEAELRREQDELKAVDETGEGLNSGDDNDEEAYEAWKARELKRIKREREAREKMEREKQEVERLHHMTEEERRLEQKLNPKVITNKAQKGKYKFLQKYYHRGAFFLNEEDSVLQRDFSSATLEDHFNKTVLPKVMQVKNFGRSGRTKYTHLVDQDTTNYESPWVADTGMNLKFHTTKGGGMKQVFDRPAVKKRK